LKLNAVATLLAIAVVGCAVAVCGAGGSRQLREAVCNRSFARDTSTQIRVAAMRLDWSNELKQEMSARAMTNGGVGSASKCGVPLVVVGE